jgi:hypothetical protein
VKNYLQMLQQKVTFTVSEVFAEFHEGKKQTFA